MDALAAFRRLHIHYCWHCRCHDGGMCFRRMEAVKPWQYCGLWSEA